MRGEKGLAVLDYMHVCIYKCMVSFMKDGIYILQLQEPQEIQLGESYYESTMSGAKRRKVSTYKRFYYVPLLETLKQLLSTNEYITEVFNSHQSNSQTLNDFCDGESFRTHPLFKEDLYALQIVAYYDELEVVNPIGTYVKKHKLGCLFFTLGNVRPRFRSVLNTLGAHAVLWNTTACATIA